MSCDRVSLKRKFSLQIFFKVAEACEATATKAATAAAATMAVVVYSGGGGINGDGEFHDAKLAE